MKALTVQQPWAWAIIHGGKDVENRTQAWTYRGPLAIHAGRRWSERGAELMTHMNVICRHIAPDGGLDDLVTPDKPEQHTFGAIIGVVDLVDVHLAQPDWLDKDRTACCESPWGESQYDEHGGRLRRDIVHLVLENPRPLAEPIPCKGRLGLWTPPAEVVEQLQAVM